MQANDMSSPETFETADAITEAPISAGPDAEAQALERAMAVCRSFYPSRSEGLGEAMVLGFLLQNFQEFKSYLQTHPKNLQMSAERWIASAAMSCNDSLAHSETADMLGVLGDSGLIDQWKDWKKELEAEKKVAGNELAAAMKNSRLKIDRK